MAFSPFDQMLIVSKIHGQPSYMESGEINEDIYQSVLQCIIHGGCPHVEQVPEEYASRSVTSGMIIAAAASTTNALKQPVDSLHDWDEDDYVGLINDHAIGCFNLIMFKMLLIKKNQK